MPAPSRLTRILLILAKTVALLAIAAVILLSAFCAWLIFSGEHDWKTTRASLLARGEKLDLSSFIPPALPDNENFFADPLWAELADLVPGETIHSRQPRLPQGQRAIDLGIPPLSPEESATLKQTFPDLALPASPESRSAVALSLWKQRDRLPGGEAAAARAITTLLAPCQPLLAHITDLSLRPGGYFPTNYQDAAFTSLSHLTYLLRLSQLFMVQSQALIVTGDTAAAAAGIHTIFRLARAISSESLAISFLVRNSILGCALAAIDSGLRHHAWSDAQLADFESTLSPYHILSGLPAVLRTERAFANAMVALHYKNPGLLADLKAVQDTSSVPATSLLKLVLPGSQASLNRTIQDWLDLLASSASYPDLSRAFTASSENLTRPPLSSFRNFLALLTLPALQSLPQSAALTQTRIDQTRLACALERYRLAHGSLPDSLSALVPAYLPAIPADTLAAAPMHYERQTTDSFLLYSVGPDLDDDSGQPGPRTTEGDLVWGHEYRPR